MILVTDTQSPQIYTRVIWISDLFEITNFEFEICSESARHSKTAVSMESIFNLLIVFTAQKFGQVDMTIYRRNVEEFEANLPVRQSG